MNEMNWKNFRINSPKDLEGLTLPDELFEPVPAEKRTVPQKREKVFPTGRTPGDDLRQIK